MKKFKKITAILLAATLTVSLTACGSSSSDTSSSSTSSDTSSTTDSASSDTSSSSSDETVGTSDIAYDAANPETFNTADLPHYKLAFSYYSFSDKLGSQFKEVMNYLGDAFNCEFVFFESGQGDEAVTNIESVLAAGDIDGVIYVGATPSTVAVAEKYKVPYVAVCGFPSSEDEIKTDSTYEYFLGGIVDDDVWAGNHCIQALYDAGCRNVCLSGMTQGFVKSHDDRATAYLSFVDSHDDMKSLSESYTMGETAADISTFAASFPTMDGIMFTAGSDTIYLSMESEGIADGSVKVAAVDISSQTGTYFKNGVQVWTCGGQYGTAECGFAILYSFLSDGTRVISDKTTPIIRQYIEITSYDDYVDYVKLVEGTTPVYTADEIAAMIPYFGNDYTFSDYEAEAVNFSLESLASRR
jgi:hypothetical protein